MHIFHRQNRWQHFVILALTLIVIYPAEGLCITRSTGLGINFGVWNINGRPTRIISSNNGRDASIEIGGFGPSFNIFSRAWQNVFWELNFLTCFSAQEQHTNYIIEEMDATGILSWSLGMRYDIFSTRLPTSMQPYISAGWGRYWISSTNNILNQGQIIDLQKENDSITLELNDSIRKEGAYFGGGMNLLLFSWFALNFDFRYHMVEYKFSRKPSGLAFNFGWNFMWGKKRDMFRVQEVRQVVKDIYPSFFQFYRTYPLAFVKVRNLVGYPIEIKIKSSVSGYSERIYESSFVKINGGKSEDIPIRAFLNSELMNASNPKPARLNVEVEGRTGIRTMKTLKSVIVIHQRNAWDGDTERLVFFVTPEDPKILEMSRSVVNRLADSTNAGVENLKFARAIFDEIPRLGIQYVRNPHVPFDKDNHAFFASETLVAGGGDSDDLVVLFSSLLESAGIKTAFMEVQSPDTQTKYLFLLFDSEVSPENGPLISSNEKRYIVRENENTRRSLWIPLDLNQLNTSFEDAWKSGALNYLKNSVLEKAFETGRLKVVPVE